MFKVLRGGCARARALSLSRGFLSLCLSLSLARALPPPPTPPHPSLPLCLSLSLELVARMHTLSLSYIRACAWARAVLGAVFRAVAGIFQLLEGSRVLKVDSLSPNPKL